MRINQAFDRWAVLTLLLLSTIFPVQGQLLWTVGLDDNGWPFTADNPGDGGGENATFVQEAGVNDLPGFFANEEFNQQADDDYYFAGVYESVIPSNGDYPPVGVVVANEEAVERAFADIDNSLRYHFNLPEDMLPTDRLTVSFDALNLDMGEATRVVPDPRYGVEVYFNGVLVQEQIVIRPAQLGVTYTTPQFTLESVNAEVGPGPDNIVLVKGINYNSEGGGNWMGIDYVQLNRETEVIPPPVYPWAVGKDDGEWPLGDGGGENASFVQEDSTTNPLPGVANSPEEDQMADNDYYFAGSYTKMIPSNGDYPGAGTVSVNEEAAERALTPGNTELRYHFNLPNSLKPTDLMAVTFEPLNLDDPSATVTDPRYGVEVYVNNVLVQPEVLVRPEDLGIAITTPQFSLQSVGAEVGPGWDNIVTLRGISKSAEGGGNWMGIDYVQLNPVAQPVPDPVLPWAVGRNDNTHVRDGSGGGPNASFMQEDGTVNALPGDPNSPETDREVDNDYYLAGLYSTVISGNGNYPAVGPVPVNEEAAERALTTGDTEQRYHFNLPASMGPNDQLSIAFDALDLDQGDETRFVEDPRFGVSIFVNNVQVMDEVVIRPDQLGVTFSTPAFTLAQVNAQAGHGFDNIVTLKGKSFSTEGGGDWMGIDYIQMNPVLPAPFPWSVGRDDNNQSAGNGGGPNTSFVQENGGSNLLPGNANSPEVNQQADDDYYFAGEYTTVIPSVFEVEQYEPVGPVLVNEEAAERAFAGSDNTLRYHFNLPATLKPTDQLIVTFDAYNIDQGDANRIVENPRYGVEIYVNEVLVQPEILITPTEIDVDYTTPPFTLEQVNAIVGPGGDNIVRLQGISYSGDGGGSWMGIDYVQLDPMPAPVFPILIGMDDNTHIRDGNGGGPNASFMQENGQFNDLPGNPRNLEIDQQVDDDYYLAGVYDTVLPGNGDYPPAGLVARNEEAAERAFAGVDNELRYHFNLPTTLQPTDTLVVTYDPLNLDMGDETRPVTDPRYGVTVLVNGVEVEAERIIRPGDLDTDIRTREFTLEEVGAETGLGKDNIVTLRGTNYDFDGGGNWMGIDYVLISGPQAEVIEFTSSVVADGKITLNWTGGGTLQWAPAVDGPWTAFNPAPTPPYTEDIATAQNRFYRVAQ